MSGGSEEPGLTCEGCVGVTVPWTLSFATRLVQAMVSSHLDHRNVPQSGLPSCSPCVHTTARGVFLSLKPDYLIPLMASFSGSQVPSGLHPSSSAGLQGSHHFPPNITSAPLFLFSLTPRIHSHVPYSNPVEFLFITSTWNTNLLYPTFPLASPYRPSDLSPHLTSSGQPVLGSISREGAPPIFPHGPS